MTNTFFRPINGPLANSQTSIPGSERQYTPTQGIPPRARIVHRKSNGKAEKASVRPAPMDFNNTREQPVRARKILPSIEDSDAQQVSPFLEEQEQDSDYQPQQTSDFEGLSYGSSPTSSYHSSPQRSPSKGGGIDGNTGRRSGAMSSVPRTSGYPTAERSTRRHCDSLPALNENNTLLHRGPASIATPGDPSAINPDTSLNISMILDGTQDDANTGVKGLDGPVYSRRKQDPRVSQLRRRETDLPGKRCKCTDLHPHFTRRDTKYPDVTLFPEKDWAEFMDNVGKIADCAAHDPD